MKMNAFLVLVTVLFSNISFADGVADAACRGFGTTVENCQNMATTYNCHWVGCTSPNSVFAAICHLNSNANTCDQNNAGGNCVWLGCQAQGD